LTVAWISSNRLHWFKKIKSDLLFSNAEWNYNRERGKSKYFDNISVLPTSIFIFDKFVDGTQPEIAGEIFCMRYLFCNSRSCICYWVMHQCVHIFKFLNKNNFCFCRKLSDPRHPKSTINKTFCGHRLHWFKKIKSDLLFSNVEWNYNREREKSNHLLTFSLIIQDH
jgi:hypothetical protein